MQISTALSFLLSLTVVLASPIVKRDTATVLGDFNMITRNVQHLSNNLASYVAAPSTGIATFSQHFSDLNTHLNHTTNDVNVVGAVGQFDPDDSESIANAAVTFEQSAVQFLLALASPTNETALAADGQQSLVLGYLNKANTATLDLFTALIDALNENSFDTVSAAQDELVGAFQQAISAYS